MHSRDKYAAVAHGIIFRLAIFLLLLLEYNRIMNSIYPHHQVGIITSDVCTLAKP